MRWNWMLVLVVPLVAGTAAVAAPPPMQEQKPVVSIDDIKDLAQTGQAGVLRQMIETTVVNTGKFRIMERGAQGMSALVGEQQRAKAGLVTSNTPGKIGGFEGVDYKVYGTITTAAASATRDVGASVAMQAGGRMVGSMFGGLGAGLGSAMQSNSNCTNRAASLAVDIRITDASTGELKYAKQITQTQQTGTTCGAPAQVDLNGLMRSAAQGVSMGLVTTMYPVKVVDVDGSQILLNYGEGLLTPGEVFAVFQQGKKIVDPDTGAVLGNSESLLGLARITEVMPKMSKASLVTAFAVAPSIGSVAREATAEQLQAFAPPKRR